MGEFPTKFLIDGIDRLGKSSLAEQIQQELGYHLSLHYAKPKVLANLRLAAEDMKKCPVSERYMNLSETTVDNLARRLYQEECNAQLFNLLTTSIPIVVDRTHLGEMVYAPLYRGYDGDYVMKLERDFLESKPFSGGNDVRLILLTTSYFDMLKDDGLSFDWGNKEREQEMFIQAFNKSLLPNKVIIDVHNGKGGYKPFSEVLQEALYKNPTN